MSANKLPTFLIIGAQKSATRWLRLNLGKHPDVYVASRELAFFNHNFSNGGAWYLEQFKGWEGQPEVGEATPGYMMWRESPRLIAARIHGMLPEARLFALLRNPIDRAYSAFVHHIVMGRIPPEMSLLEYVRAHPPEEDRLGIVVGGWYGRSLAPYARRFGDRLKVLIHEDVKAHPDRVYADVLSHLEIDDGFRPPDIDDVVFSNVLPSGSVHASPEGRRSLTFDQRATLASAFVEDLDQLRELLRLDLAIWADDFPALSDKKAVPKTDTLSHRPRAASAAGLDAQREGTSDATP